MRPTTILAFSMMAFALSVQGQTTEEIVKLYQEKAAAACARLDATMRDQGSSIAAKQVSLGDTNGATLIAEQIESKIKGENVPAPHRTISALIVQYDSARQAALKPIQTASLQRLDTLLKTSVKRDMASVLKIAKARDIIEGGKHALLPAIKPAMLCVKEWTYHIPAENLTQNYRFLPDKSVLINGVKSGVWKLTQNVLRIDLQGGRLWIECSLDSEPREQGVVLREIDSSKGKRTSVTLTQNIE